MWKIEYYKPFIIYLQNFGTKLHPANVNRNDDTAQRKQPEADFLPLSVCRSEQRDSFYNQNPPSAQRYKEFERVLFRFGKVYVNKSDTDDH